MLELGVWLKINGEAIYGTRPWNIPEAITTEGIPIRFTAKKSDFYMILLEKPDISKIIINGFKGIDIKGISMLGIEAEIKWDKDDDSLFITLPPELPGNHAYALKLNI